MCIMNEVGSRKGQPPARQVKRSFTPEFKAEVVQLCLVGDRTITEVARDLGLPHSAVRAWVNAETKAPEPTGELSLTEREELRALRRENRRMREDIDILKRATAFFARETR
jgi:transposase